MSAMYSGIKAPQFLALLFLAMTLPRTSVAGSGLVTSDPAQGSVAPSGLSTITLTFGEHINLDLTIARLSASATGKQLAITPQVDPVDHRRLTIKTAPLPPGGYTVKWHAVGGGDNTPSDGAISFSVGTAGAPFARTLSQASVQATKTPGRPNDDEEDEEDPSGPWITLLVALVVILVAALVVQTLWFRGRGRLR